MGKKITKRLIETDDPSYDGNVNLHDEVASPEWYTKGGIDTWDFIAVKELPFFEGNIIKYIVRWRYKDGVTDLKKAKAYLEKLIQMYS